MTQSVFLQFSELMKKEHKKGAGQGCTINNGILQYTYRHTASTV